LRLVARTENQTNLINRTTLLLNIPSVMAVIWLAIDVRFDSKI